MSGMASNDQIFLFIIYIYIIIFSFISYVTVVVLFSKFNNIKTFEQIKSELESKKTEKGKILVIKKIHSYFQKYKFEEILFFNLKFNGKKYYPHYHYFFLGILVAICLFIIIVCGLMEDLGFWPLILAPISITVIPIIFIFAIARRKRKNSLIEVFIECIFSPIIFLEHFFKYFIMSLLTLGSSVMVFILFTSIVLLVIQNGIDINVLIQHGFNYPTTFYTNFSSVINLSDFDIEKQSTQLSLAGFYFTLAVGGTVVFSLIDRYFNEVDSLREELLKQADILLDLFREPDFLLCLNFSDIVSFNYENFRNSNKEIISFDAAKIEKFHRHVSKIYDKLELSKVEDKSFSTYMYFLFTLLIVVTYTLGIMIIFLPDRFEIIWLKLFILDSYFFGLFIFIIYTVYRRKL